MTTEPLTIGNGVKVGDSKIEGAGRGLFVSRAICKGTLFTEFAGKRLVDKFAAARCAVQTHILHMSAAREGQLGSDIYIDGERKPIIGHGGGSFVNHQRFKKDCNAEFALWNDKVYLRATRDIILEEEVYVHCGTDIDVMMGRKRRIVVKNSDGKDTIETVTIVLPIDPAELFAS